MNLPANPSESVKRRNPHLYGPAKASTSVLNAVIKPESVKLGTKKRVRQSTKPLLNKLETEYFERLKLLWPNDTIRPQAKRYMLANGLWYKPDFTAVLCTGSGETAWEVKGPHSFRGGFENLKMAAFQWREVQFILAWKQDGKWVSQEILP